jgi:hypothetical protein
MKFIIAAGFCFFAAIASAQQTLFDSVNRQREVINQKGMVVLGSWALLNIGSGIIGQRQTTGEQQHFHRMNIFWGGVNLILAGIGYFGSNQNSTMSQRESFKKQATAEKLFLLNTALDLGYIAFGLYTRERGNRFTGAKKERLHGTGRSLLVQGGFLAVFDGVMYLLHSKNGFRLQHSLSPFTFGRAENGIGVLYRF